MKHMFKMIIKQCILQADAGCCQTQDPATTILQIGTITKTRKIVKTFMYGGCKENRNRFVRKFECVRRC